MVEKPPVLTESSFIPEIAGR